VLTTYRIVYGLVLALFLGNLLETNYYGTVPPYTSALIFTATLCLVGLFALVVGFQHMKPPLFWGLVLLWEVLFVWYAWFSPAAPFALHELHTLDPEAVASERRAHYARAGAVFGALFIWFLSLAITRSFHGRSRRASPALPPVDLHES
jgi:hypothetical protein